jgi:serine phosphatase RsbU (regulator of sigma subunit)
VRKHAGFDEFIITEYKANRQPCGYHHLNLPFTAHSIRLEKGDRIYSLTDGFADQFGGPKGKKFRCKQFKEILVANGRLTLDKQKELLSKAIGDWKGDMEQVDDILVIGVEI